MNISQNIRLFVAVRVPEEIKEEISKIQMSFKVDGLRKVSKENMHLTLCFIGEVPEKETDRINKVLKEIQFKSMKISFEKITSFPNEITPRVIIIKLRDNKEFLDLIKEIHTKLNIQMKDVVPHITLFRVKQYSQKEVIKKEMQSIKIEKDISFDVDSFFLYSSELGESGPVYKLEEEYNATNSL